MTEGERGRLRGWSWSRDWKGEGNREGEGRGGREGEGRGKGDWEEPVSPRGTTRLRMDERRGIWRRVKISERG